MFKGKRFGLCAKPLFYIYVKYTLLSPIFCIYYLILHYAKNFHIHRRIQENHYQSVYFFRGKNGLSHRYPKHCFSLFGLAKRVFSLSIRHQSHRAYRYGRTFHPKKKFPYIGSFQFLLRIVGCQFAKRFPTYYLLGNHCFWYVFHNAWRLWATPCRSRWYFFGRVFYLYGWATFG